MGAWGAGCDISPPPHGGSPDGPRVIRSSPADGDDEVARRRRFRLWFDRRLAPRSVHRGRVQVESGPHQPFLSLSVDPVDKAVVATPVGGVMLEPRVRYRLVARDLRDLRGHAMEEEFTATFRTGEETGTLSAGPQPPWAEIRSFFRAECGGEGGCHAPDTPALGLVLTTGAGVRRTALGVPSEQTKVGAARRNSGAQARGLTGMPIVDVLGGAGHPGSSYLVYKMLADPRILGDPMPPARGDTPSDPDRTEQARRVVDWIRAGAPTR